MLQLLIVLKDADVMAYTCRPAQVRAGALVWEAILDGPSPALVLPNPKVGLCHLAYCSRLVVIAFRADLTARKQHRKVRHCPVLLRKHNVIHTCKTQCLQHNIHAMHDQVCLYIGSFWVKDHQQYECSCGHAWLAVLMSVKSLFCKAFNTKVDKVVSIAN